MQAIGGPIRKSVLQRFSVFSGPVVPAPGIQRNLEIRDGRPMGSEGRGARYGVQGGTEPTAESGGLKHRNRFFRFHHPSDSLKKIGSKYHVSQCWIFNQIGDQCQHHDPFGGCSSPLDFRIDIDLRAILTAGFKGDSESGGGIGQKSSARAAKAIEFIGLESQTVHAAIVHREFRPADRRGIGRESHRWRGRAKRRRGASTQA